MRRFSIAAILALAATVAMPLTATAVPITGSVTFGGSWEPTPGPGIVGATGVDIIPLTTVQCAASSTCTGDYAALNGNLLSATYNDFTFAPLGGLITPLWEFTFNLVDYSFDLLTLVVDEQDADSLVLLGTGTLKISSFDDTPGTWSFSGDTSGGGVFSFSATNTAIPEPALLTLFGLGLAAAGTAASRRRRRN